MTGYNLLWITLLLLAVQYSRRADCFECYQCEDCPTIGEGDLKYLKECVLPEDLIVQPTTTTSAAPPTSNESLETEDLSSEVEKAPASTQTTSTITTTSVPTSTTTSTTTSAATSTVSLATTSTVAANLTDLEETFLSQNGTDSEEEDYELLGNSTVLEDAIVQNTTDTGKPSTSTSAESATTQKKKKASSWLFSQSKEDSEPRSNEWDLNGEISQRASPQLPNTKPMCYVLTIKYDGYDVVNRGCGVVLPDRNLTCKMLSKGQPYSECGLCEGNRCNSAPKMKIALQPLFSVVVLIVVHLWK